MTDDDLPEDEDLDFQEDEDLEDEDEDDELGDTLWDELERDRPAFMDEKLAPKIDFELLTKLVRRELPGPIADSVYQLIYAFQSWNFAHYEILMAEHKRLYGPGTPGEHAG
ncbi:MAG: hypothetical protein WD847_01400 [Pirellulales bacterium]